MKNQVVMFSLAAMLASSVTFGQGVENDDMYFTSKDRAKLKAQQASDEEAYLSSIKKTRKNETADDVISSSDSYNYSARNENPEFTARSNSQEAQSDNQDYFVNDYRYNNSSNFNTWNNNYNSWNNNFNNWYSNPWYSSNYYSSSMYGWNSPFYGSYYDSWGNPWMSPYRSGWSSSFGFYMGNSWNYGWGSSIGFGIGYNYGNPYGWGGYGGYGWNSYPGSVVIINNGESGRNVAYGKRGSHGGMVTSRPQGVSSRTRPTTDASTPTGSGRTYGNPGGRVSTGSVSRGQTQEDYYNRSWRNTQPTTGSSSPAPSRSSSNGWSRSSGSNDSWNNHQSSPSTPSYNNSGRSGSSDGGGSRSSAPASSGSNGRTRGRD